MSEIRVNTIFLENLANRLNSTSSDLRSYSCLDGGRLTCTPELDQAYEDLGQKWDEKREGLAKSLDAIAEGFVTAARSFVEVDQGMAAEIQSGSPGQAQ